MADNGDFALISPNGHYCHSIGEETHCRDGQLETLTGFVKYGQNSEVFELAEDVGAMSEHDDEFWKYCGNAV